jgi:hypothetical protein
VTSHPTLQTSPTPGFDATRGAIHSQENLILRIGRRVRHEALEALPPTLFFFVGFNIIVLTTNLLVTEYQVAVSNFMLATMGALVVGKAVLLANNMAAIRRYDRAPLIRPILFKTAVYWILVFFARLLERFVHFALLEGDHPGGFLTYLVSTFSWPRFLAISIWVFVLFLIYVTVSEFTHLFGGAEIWRLLFTRRPSELQLNRSQRIRELLRLSRLADEHSAEEFSNPNSTAHAELIGIIHRISRQ